MTPKGAESASQPVEPFEQEEVRPPLEVVVDPTVEVLHEVENVDHDLLFKSAVFGSKESL